MPIQSKCQQYSPSEVDLEYISNLAFEELGQCPFRWQLETTMAILTGNDIVLDVGTGCGKSLCFSLPLLLRKTDISLTVSPLMALMIDQVRVLLNIVTSPSHDLISKDQYSKNFNRCSL